MIGFEFVVDQVDERIEAGDGLKLNPAQDGAFEDLWESILDSL